MKTIFVGKGSVKKQPPRYNAEGVIYSNLSQKYIVVIKGEEKALNGPRTAFKAVAQFTNQHDADHHFTTLIQNRS